jgi:hypothetical protein
MVRTTTAARHHSRPERLTVGGMADQSSEESSTAKAEKLREITN